MTIKEQMRIAKTLSFTRLENYDTAGNFYTFFQTTR